MLKIFKNFSKTTLLVGLIAFLTRTGFFMSLPFLAIYLTRDHLFTEGQIGFVLGASPLLYSSMSLVNGVFIERFTKKGTLIFALVMTGICYLGISFSSQQYWLLFLLMSSLGWVRSIGDIAATTLLVQQTDEKSLRNAYNLRFIAINAGAIVGPLIGAVLAYQKSLIIFIISGVIHLGLAMSLVFVGMVEPKWVERPSYFFANVKILFTDTTLLILTLINFLIWTIYSQLDTTLPQYLTQVTHHPALIVGVMMFINALICVLASSTALKFTENTSVRFTGILGSCLMGLGFLCMVFSTSFFIFVITALATSIGELLTILSNGLLVSRMAPKQLVASYNGFFNLSSIGLFLGPTLGGYGLQFFGGKLTFLLLTIFPLLCVVGYWILGRKQNSAIHSSR